MHEEIVLDDTTMKVAADDCFDNHCYPQTLSRNQCISESKFTSQFSITHKINETSQLNQEVLLNCSEKIILIIDTACETTATQFKSGTGTKYCPLYMITRVIEIFLHNKSMLNSKHEFALIILDAHKAHWICDFTGSVQVLLSKLELIEENLISDNQIFFDLQEAFKCVYDHITDTSLLKNNTIRVILIYCRSNILPKFNTTEYLIQRLVNNPNFFLDVLYVHESPNSENKCEKIYTELTKLDIKNISYVMEVGRNAVGVHNFMARLLAHPLQRVSRRDTIYYMHSSILKPIKTRCNTQFIY